ERTRALQKSEERLARLYDIISSNLDFADKTRRLLAYGCDQLGLQHGVLAHIEQGQHTVLYACSSDATLHEGQSFPLEETYCGQMLKNQALTAITHVGLSGWSQLSCYQQYRLESYIGTPIYTGGQLYGTLSFSGYEARETPFTQAEQELVQLMAQWLSMELVHIQFEDRLLEQRNTISHILESTAEAFIAVDRQQTILYTNSLTQDLLKLETLDLVGQDLQTVAPQTRELFGAALQATLENEQSCQFDRYYQDNGKWLEVAIHPTLQGASISLRDITQQKANAEMLSHTLGIKNAILNSANFTIIATDENGLIMSFNKAAERILGYSASEVIGQHNPLMFHDSQEIAARARELSEELPTPIQPGFEVFTALARRGIPDEQEWTYICSDGSRLPVLLSITEMTDEQGNCIGFLGIGVDITERKRIERIRDEFISTVSHELRTPLTSIRGSLGLLSGNLGEQLPDQAHSLIEIAGRNTERLLHLINDILDINKIESGKMAFNYEPLPLAGFLQQALENNLSYAREFNVALKLSTEDSETELYADEHRLMQVMNNLLSNAVKFSHAGGTVEIEARHQQHFVRISVTDHGKGIPAGFRDKIFQRFSQADASDSRNTGGTGLGLSIAQAIVEQHGGQLNYVSQPGIGTTFYFDLPVYRHQSITRIKDQIISLSPPQPYRLLICEDDPDIAGLLQLMLARHGYQSDLCATAAEAHEALADQHYDALLLDILLPDLNGLDLIRQLRGAEATRTLPIIVISAMANEARSQLEGGAADIVDWLDKPLDQDRLLDSVRRALLHLPDKPRVLYVEDDVDLQNVIGRMLQEQVALFRATSLQEAREQLASQNFDLILLDVNLPDGSGLTLLEQLRDQRPPPATVIFSNRDLDNDVTTQVSAALCKSNTSQQTLLETLAACLQQRTRPERGSPNDKETA
ncbi:MAG: response regulator, partial [Thiohalophilus sp.]|uniref:response regulator n=1 Tax=Thiohalophilus sp. TaxID=3028392 RepID=UPI00286FD62C